MRTDEEDPTPLPAPDEPTAEDKVREKAVERALDALAEHYDAVHVFGVYKEGDRTARYDKGRGNYYARYGMVRQWVIREEMDP